MKNTTTINHVKNKEFFEQIPDVVKHIIGLLNEAGHDAYIVGGACRDFLLGKAPHDYDICTSARPDQVKAILNENFAIYPTGETYGTLTVAPIESPADTYEVTTFRGDNYKGLGHVECETVFVSKVQEDLFRRDFTFNAIIYSLKKKCFIDYYNGIEDLHQGRIASINNAYGESYRQDPLRILRAYRFMSRLSTDRARPFRLAPVDESFITRNAALLLYISAERIQAELFHILIGDNVAETLDAMLHHGILDTLLPEVALMSRLQQNNPYHNEYRYFERSLFSHTISVVAHTKPDPLTRLAALLHDIGKPSTITIRDAGYWSFHGHPDKGAEMAEKILSERFRLSKKDKDLIVKLIRLHDTPFTDNFIINRTHVKRIMAEFDGNLDYIEKWADLKQADIVSHSSYQDKRAAFERAIVEFMPTVYDIINAHDAFAVKDLAINGDDVMRILHKPRGPIIGEALRYACEQVMLGNQPNTKEALSRLIKEQYNVST